MKKALLFVFAIMLATGMAGHADAMMHGKGGKGKGMGMMAGGMDHGKHMMQKLSDLGLDDKQMESVKAVHLKTRKEAIRKKADEEIAGIELKELLSKDPVDMTAAEAKVRQIEALRGDIRMIHIKAHEEIKGLLTPVQRKKFVSMAGMMHGDCMDMMGECDMMGGGMGHGMMGGMGGKGGCGMMSGMGRGMMDKGMGMKGGCGMMGGMGRGMMDKGMGMKGGCGMMGGMDHGDQKGPEKKDTPPASGHQH